MSPEQARGRVLDVRSDVFAAGIVLWELLAGRPLHREPTEFETMRRICEEDVPPPSSVATEVPAALDGLVARALTRDREQRLPSAAQMLKELDAIREQQQLRWDHAGLASAVERERHLPTATVSSTGA
jgi:serine/threonine-protein kinase